MNLPNQQTEEIKKQILHKEAEVLRLMRQKMTIFEFEPIAIIGKGAFGEVRVCRKKDNGEIVAIKKLKKSDIF